MKVIEKGRPQKGWSKEFVCTGKGNRDGGCQAKLLVEFDDLFRTFHTDMTGARVVFLTFKCAECGVLTDIPTKEWPSTTSIPDQSVWETLHRDKAVIHG
jgi:hypothetical protein